jgi:hypothetical protein
MAYANVEDRKAACKKHYAENKQAYLDRNKRKLDAIVEFLDEFKATASCEKCGEDHPATLDFHHRDPNEKEYNIGAMVSRVASIDTVRREIAKCMVLCSNCHRKLHYELRKN